jgi:hypothetical protein
MPRYITILGTSHDLQGAEKRKSSVNDPTFSEAIEFLLSGKDFVFEEASGCGPTIAEESAHEKLGPGHYLDVDPSRAHRERYGIGDTGGQPIPIDFLHPVDGYLCPEYDLEQEKRETFGCAKSKGRILPVLFSFADICTPSAWLSGCVTLDMSLKRGTTCHMKSSAEKNIKAEARRWIRNENDR